MLKSKIKSEFAEKRTQKLIDDLYNYFEEADKNGIYSLSPVGWNNFRLIYGEYLRDVLPKTKVIVLCGSSRFVDVMAVTAWLLEKEEGAITMGLHLLPNWYCKDKIPDHLAEHEGVAAKMDELHKRKIDMADEIFIINYNDYVGDSTMAEMTYAAEKNIPGRWFSPPPGKPIDPIALKVLEIMDETMKKK